MRKSTLFSSIISVVMLMVPLHINMANATEPMTCQVLIKSILKKSAKQTVKKGSKASAKAVLKKTGKMASHKISVKAIGKEVLVVMTEKQRNLFTKMKYGQTSIRFGKKTKPLLVSKDFDPNLKIPREFTGNWDPVAFHKNNPKYVIDGCETNLGRMKRGLAPLYKDPSNKNPAWHGYSEFELHHGGQKADPDYIALMGKEHKTESKILHTKNNKDFKSEINRAEFSKKERMPMYKDWAEKLEQELYAPKFEIK